MTCSFLMSFSDQRSSVTFVPDESHTSMTQEGCRAGAVRAPFRIQ